MHTLSAEKQRVPNTEIRLAVIEYLAEYEITWTDFAKELGLFTHGTKGDSTRLRRMLGIIPTNGKRTQSLSYRNAVKLVRAIGRMPVEFKI